MADALTLKQQKALEFIQVEIQSHGRPPTLREIGAKIGISSTNGVRYLLDGMERKGYLERRPMLSRGIELTERASAESGLNGMRAVPILGRIAAGAPLLATEHIEGHVAVDRSIARSEDTFALSVRGDSMIDAGIHEGDVIFARPQATALTGDIVVALLGDEATVKYFRLQGDRILLEPANRYFSPIVVEKGTPGFRILGKVVGLMRRI